MCALGTTQLNEALTVAKISGSKQESRNPGDTFMSEENVTSSPGKPSSRRGKRNTKITENLY